MTDLVTFLNARLDEDEAIAKVAPHWKPERWTATQYADKDSGRNWRVDAEPRCVVDSVIDHDAEHIARHDPARVLREVEAKRRIVAEHADTVGSVWISGHGHHNQYCARCVESDRDGDYWMEEPGPCETLRALAAVWSDHPDYDPAWA